MASGEQGIGGAVTPVKAGLGILLLVLSCLIMLTVIAHRTPWLMADETMYARGAWNLAHRGFMLPHIPGAMNYPPLYPMLLALPAGLFAIQSSYLSYQVINIILLVVGALLAYDIARSRQRGLFPLGVAALYMVTPSSLAYVPLIMSENLTILLMLFVGYALHRWAARQDSRWLLWGWAAALGAPFCRVTALVVPFAFLLAIRTHPQRLSLKTRRSIKHALLIMAGIAALLLAVLPTSVLKVYHPWSTIVVAVRTLFSLGGWETLATHSLTNLALLLVGSAGLILLLLLKGTADERPIRRYVQVLVFGLLFVTIGYMQYGSAGPHAPLYAAAQRYMDPGIAACIPFVLILTHRYQRRWVIPLVVGGGLLAIRFCPAGGFKAGQTLASVGLGLGMIEFPSLVAGVPRSLAIFLLCSVVPLLLLGLPRKMRWTVLPLMLALFTLLSFDSLRHSLAMSKARENIEPRLWELSTKVPPDAEIVVEEGDADDELMNTLFSGLFWLPQNNVYVVGSARIQSVRGRPIVQLTKRWLPDRLLHSGTYKWYLRGHSAPAVSSSRLYYDFGGPGDRFLFSAPPADEGHARWTGDNPVIELHLLPRDYLLYLSHQPRLEYGECSGIATLNEKPLGRFTSTDSLVSFRIESQILRPDGRQLLTLRISPRSNPPEGELWLLGIRLDWIYCKPLPAIRTHSPGILLQPTEAGR